MKTNFESYNDILVCENNNHQYDELLDMKIYQTFNYGKFKHLQGNRHINYVQIEKLKLSMKELYCFTIIIVNQFFEIIDGQNRFEAIKELGLPIRYIIMENYGLIETQKMNTNVRVWDNISYLNSFCEIGKKDYLMVKNFMNQFPQFNLTSTQVILSNKTVQGVITSLKTKNLVTDTNKKGSYNISKFQTGGFKVDNFDLAVINAKKILKVKPFYKGYNRTTFVRTLISLFKNEKFNFDTFLNKLQYQQTALKDCSTVTQYYQLVEDIYNYKSRNKISLKFL